MKRKELLVLSALFMAVILVLAEGKIAVVKAEETEQNEIFDEELVFIENWLDENEKPELPEFIDEKKDSIRSSDGCFYYKFIDEDKKVIRITGYDGSDTEVIIPNEIDGNKVQNISSWAFYNNRTLTGIYLPEGVTNIDSAAFYACNNLSSISMPASLTDIGSYAFCGCVSLSSITIPENVIQIGGAAFAGCNSITEITNNSMAVIDLSTVNPNIYWYDKQAQEIVKELKAKAKAKAGRIKIEKNPVETVDETIKQAVENIIQSIAPVSGVFYYDVQVYMDVSGEQISNEYLRNIAVEFDYPKDITKEHDFIVLYNNIVLYNSSQSEDKNITKYNNRLKFEIDGSGIVTIIAFDKNVRAFVERLYSYALGREADETGLNLWVGALINKKSSGVDAGYGFIFSDECKENNLSNEEFVEILYNTFMNRSSDEEGKREWVSQLNAGVEREKIFEGFVFSNEFKDICKNYGINVGSIYDVDGLVGTLSHYRNWNADITKFVARCYTQALGRDYETVGLEDWCRVIIKKSNTPKQVAQNFIFSDEFTQKNLSDEEYVKVLYRTFMGREADEGGLAAWVGVLKSGRENRAKVLEGFSDSVEFAGILKSFGLN